MLARKLLGGLVAAASTSVMILGATVPAQAATTPAASALGVPTSNNLGAPNLAMALSYCNSFIPLHPDSGAWEGRGMLPYASSAGTANCILETGNNSTGVTALQESLYWCYHKAIATDGIFGPATYSALMAVQRQVGTTVDGIYGPGTRSKMYWFGGMACHPITYYQGF